MTDDIEELREMCDIIIKKIEQFTDMYEKESTVKSLERNLNILEEKIEEIEENQ